MYYRNADIVFVVYDVTQRSSFDEVGYWLQRVQEDGFPLQIVRLVENKNDLARVVSK